MSKVVQIRDVDDQTYLTLRTRAASEGLSLNAYLRNQLKALASGPTMMEILRRADLLRSGGVDRAEIASAVRELREENAG